MPQVLLQNYKFLGEIKCGEGGPPVAIGDSVRLFLNVPANPDFPVSVDAKVISVNSTSQVIGPCRRVVTLYTFEYDSDVTGAILTQSDILLAECVSAYDGLDARVTLLEEYVAEGPVQSVNGLTGVVELTVDDVDGLKNYVDAIPEDFFNYQSPFPVSGGANNTALLETKITQNLGSEIIIPKGDFYVDSTFTNEGAEIEGVGRLLRNETFGSGTFPRQLNTYADKGLFIGGEYLHAFLSAIKAAGTVVKTAVFGDSTVTDAYFTTAYRLSALLEVTAIAKGCPSKMGVDNYGVSGTSWPNLNAIPYLATDRKLMFIKYGINDGSLVAEATRLSSMAATMRAKLTAIRAATNGGISSLSIVLIGPNATSDLPNGRDEKWYEQLRAVYVAIAREFQCAYFDTYAFLRDSSKAANRWMDDPVYGDGFGFNRPVHYFDGMQAQIWGRIMDEILAPGAVVAFANNLTYNYGSAHFIPSGALPPSSYAIGTYIVRIFDNANYAVDGTGVLFRNQDGGVIRMMGDRANGRVVFDTSSNFNSFHIIHEAVCNRGIAHTRLFSAAPNQYSAVAEVCRVTTVEGWPFSGHVFTTKDRDGVTSQTLCGYGGDAGKRWMRDSVSSTTWSAGQYLVGSTGPAVAGLVTATQNIPVMINGLLYSINVLPI